MASLAHPCRNLPGEVRAGGGCLTNSHSHIELGITFADIHPCRTTVDLCRGHIPGSLRLNKFPPSLQCSIYSQAALSRFLARLIIALVARVGPPNGAHECHFTSRALSPIRHARHIALVDG